MSEYVLVGDVVDLLPTLEAESFDAVLCDPPYGLSFMGKAWDHGVPSREVWEAVARTLKPGAHLMAFGGTRTFHRLACAIEDAGFEIRDSLCWLYGQGFPKSLDISKAIDKARSEDAEPVRSVCRFLRAAMDARGLKSRDMTAHFGECDPRLIDHWAARDTDSQPALPTVAQWATLRMVLDLSCEMDAEVERLNARKGTVGEAWTRAKVVGTAGSLPGLAGERFTARDNLLRAPESDAAKAWQGYGSSLKPAWEPCILAMKPTEGTFAANALAHGVAGINVDGGRIGTTVETWPASPSPMMRRISGAEKGETEATGTAPPGRWPANVLFSHHEDCREFTEVHRSWDHVNGGPVLKVGEPRWECHPDCPVRMLDEQSGIQRDGVAVNRNRKGQKPNAIYGKFAESGGEDVTFGGSGGASRFFKVAGYTERERCELANVAELSSSQPSEPDDSAPSGAATANCCEAERQGRLPHGPGSTERSNGSTQPPSPAPIAESPDSTDTTQTTPNRCESCGSVLHVTAESTNSVSAERVAGGSVRVSGTRFRYTPKASRGEREAGLEGMPLRDKVVHVQQSEGRENHKMVADGQHVSMPARNLHPCVKPLALCEYLARLILPPKRDTPRRLLVPFSGSGSEMIGALLAGWDEVVGIEREPEYVAIAEARLAWWTTRDDWRAELARMDAEASRRRQRTGSHGPLFDALDKDGGAA